jgi:ribosomal protein S10
VLQHQSDVVPALRDARRPKPLSLKEQSITLIDRIQAAKEAWDISELETIRRALEQLPDNE